jgi:hypothetical protein
MEIKLKGVDWPTLQSFFRKTILDPVKANVCSLVYKPAVYWRGDSSLAAWQEVTLVDFLC